MKVIVYSKKVNKKVNKKLDKSEEKLIAETALATDVYFTNILEVEFHRDELAIVTESIRGEFGGVLSSPNEIAWYYDLQNKEVNNGGDSIDVDVNWNRLKKLHDKYASVESVFIEAMNKGDLDKMKELNKQDPYRACPSLNDSFYIRWAIQHKNLEILKWAKSVDDNIDFSANSRFINPLKIVKEYKCDEIGVWLLENYPDISVFDGFGDPLQLLKDLKKTNLVKTVAKILENKEVINKIVEEDVTNLLPESIQDIFVF